MSIGASISSEARAETTVIDGPDDAVAVPDARRGTRRILSNALSLYATTVVTSVAGFVFWWAAAHLWSRAGVGGGAAAISAVQLLATAGMLGLGTLLVGELSSGAANATEMLSTSLIAAFVGGSVFSVGFVAIASGLAISSREVPSGLVGATVFVFAGGLTAVLLVFDDATLGLGEARWQLWRNMGFSCLKLAALPLVALAPGLRASGGIVDAWLIGALLSSLLLIPLTHSRVLAELGRPRLTLVRYHGRTALTHHWLNLSSAAPRLVLPVLVAAWLSPAINAGFYAALLLVGFACIISTHLSTSLFAVASGDHRALGQVLSRTMRLVIGIGGLSAVGFALLGRFLLSFFGSGYSEASGALAVLGLATLPCGVKSLYIAVCRVNGDLGRCAIVCCIGSAFEVAVPGAVLALGGGIVAVSLAWVAVTTAEGIMMWPAVSAAGGGCLPFARFMRWCAPRTFAPEETLTALDSDMASPVRARSGLSRRRSGTRLRSGGDDQVRGPIEMPTVSVVIPTYNRRCVLSAVLRPLLNDPAALEVIVVVDGCKDGSFEFLQNLATTEPRLRPMWQDNAGEAAARAAGVSAARGDVVLLLDDDVVAAEGLVSGHAAYHSAGARFLVVGYMPPWFSTTRRRGEAATRIYASDYEEVCAAYERDSKEVLLNLWAGNFSLRRRDALEVGAADSAELRYHADKEFGYRSLKAGLVGRFDRRLRARHLHERSLVQFREEVRRQAHARTWLEENYPERVDDGWLIRRPTGFTRVALKVLASRAFYPLWNRCVLAIVGLSGRMRLWSVETVVLRAIRQVDLLHHAGIELLGPTVRDAG